MLPLPGTWLISYTPIFQSSKLIGNNGAKVPEDFKLDGVFEAPRILTVTNLKVLGGNVVWHIFPSAGYMHASVAGQSQSKTGLGDLDVGAGIKWNSRTFHSIAALDVYMHADRGIRQG
ncbi:MAG: hypothetical protein A4E57_02320 [Syntrophorhabdaceae bacterium PtaU1.Bin034]|jgi:hypothetical protein|nr:MAG: hypothetical protein A4E57_02320 [Syntrophorhabdaceae bacterium PtaU1.Bin034]